MSLYKKEFMYRCSLCSINWPHKDEYKQCLYCETFCSPMNKKVDDQLIAEDEAERIKVHIDFDKYYGDRESKRMAAEADELAAASVVYAPE